MSVARNAKTPTNQIISMSDERLSQMETKLYKHLKVVVKMARMEERLLPMFKSLGHMGAAFKKV